MSSFLKREPVSKQPECLQSATHVRAKKLRTMAKIIDGLLIYLQEFEFLGQKNGRQEINARYACWLTHTL